MRSHFGTAVLTLALFACTAACSSGTPGGESTSPKTPSPTAGAARFSDQQVLAILAEHPGLAAQLEPDPADLLADAGILLAGLEQIDRVVGGCICQTIYDLSPSYELIVDQNACYGYDVFIREKLE